MPRDAKEPTLATRQVNLSSTGANPRTQSTVIGLIRSRDSAFVVPNGFIK